MCYNDNVETTETLFKIIFAVGPIVFLLGVTNALTANIIRMIILDSFLFAHKCRVSSSRLLMINQNFAPTHTILYKNTSLVSREVREYINAISTSIYLLRKKNNFKNSDRVTVAGSLSILMAPYSLYTVWPETDSVYIHSVYTYTSPPSKSLSIRVNIDDYDSNIL